MGAEVAPQGDTFLTMRVLFQSEQRSPGGDCHNDLEDTEMKTLLLSFLMCAIVMASYFTVPARARNKAAD